MLMPLLIIAAGIILSVILEISSKKSVRILPWFSILIFTFTAFYSVYYIDQNFVLFGGMLEVGGKPAIFNFIFNIGAALVVLSSMDYLKKYGTSYGEYYILIQSSVLGMMVMSGAKDILMIFMGLELMSICFYVLAGINRKKLSSNEASMKYFLLGAFATGFIVYGIALIYGAAGSTSIQNLIENFGTYSSNIIFILGFMFFLIGFSFKIAAVPFHMWVPDVYQGSATTVTSLMSTTGKTAAFSVLLIVLSAVLSFNAFNVFRPYFAAIASLSMLFGSIVAISQTNLKRMLAYSSISHAGYMAIGLAAGNTFSMAGIIFYLAAYTFMNIGAFTVISIVEGENDSRTELNSFAGLSSKNPILAAAMALFMFALAGIPPLAGFFGKYYVFISAIESHMTWLAILGVLSSVISVYFYIRVVVFMYFRDAIEDFKIEVSAYSLTAVFITALLILVFGIFPDTLMNVILSAMH
ncbi:MAG: NADH-quinone oxidoreductase subunit N [Ignavibacteriae bacterium HGW-Ignavibacteriae-3]|nr:MAG: NADH-quinone oxidoreductase subunit N [Ignavibacteriae bacterium HGW-Ignavibacteriae-3]